jgi:tripartite-type tricarboxylate transporter receptor subunit TctC
MTVTRRRLLAGPALGSALLLAAATPCLAQPMTQRPLRLVVNFAAGGTTDVMARTLARPLAAALGYPVVVENRTGALGAIGAAEVARATPDGYTVLLTTQGSLTEIPVLSPQTPYDPVTAFAPVMLVGESPLVLFAHPSFPPNDVKGLIEYARSRPQGVDLSVTGSSVKMGAYALSGAGNFKIVQIPYNGQGPALNAALGGHTPLALNTSTPALMQHVQAGRLKLIAVGSETPYKLMPGVPTVAQTLPGYVAKAWWGIFAPAGTPPAAVNKLNEAFRRALADPSVEETFVANAVVTMTSTPAELAAIVTKGLETTRTLVAKYGIKEE